MNEKLKQVHVKRLLAFALIIILVGMGSYQVGKSTVGPGQQSEQWYTPEQEASYIVGPFNTTHFFAKNHTGYGLSAYEGYEFMSADASSVINNAVGNSSSGGNTVFLKGAIYELTTQVVMNSNVTLDGETGAILKPALTLPNATIYIGSTTGHVTIKNIQLDGGLTTGIWNFAIQVYGQNVTIDHVEAYDYPTLGIVFDNASMFGTVQNCYVHDLLDGTYGCGFVCANASYINFLNNIGSRNLEDGIDIYDGSHHILIDGNTFYDNVGDGIHLEYFGGNRNHDVTITDNMLTSNGYGGNGYYADVPGFTGGYAGILIEASDNVVVSDNDCSFNGRGIMIANYRSGVGGNSSNHVNVENNKVYSNLFEGIHANGTWYSKYNGNTAKQNEETGMLFDAVAFCDISHNQVYNNGLNTTNTFYGIAIIGTSSLNTVESNTVESLNTEKYGIYAVASANTNTFMLNSVNGSVTAPILILDSTLTSKIEYCWNGSYFIGSPQGSYSYIVYAEGATYFMQNGATGSNLFSSTNVTLVEQFALGNMTAGQLYLKEIAHNTSLTLTATQNIFEQYQGVFKYWNSTGAYQFGVGGATGPTGPQGPAGPAGAASGQPFSFMIFNNATATYMVNGTDGTIVDSSTNASAVINNAIGNLTNGGTIYVKNGDYNLSAPILINNNGISITGESVNGVVSGVKFFSLTCDVMQLEGDATWGGDLRNTHISYIQFGYYPSTSGGDGISSENLEDDHKLYHTEIDHCGFNDLGVHHALNIKNWERLHIHDNAAYDTETSLFNLWNTNYESGQLYIERNELMCQHNNTVAINLTYGAAGGSMDFISENFISGGGDTGNVEYGVVINATGNTGDFSIANVHFYGNYYDDAPMLFTYSGSSYIGQVTIEQDKFFSVFSSIPYDIEIGGHTKAFRILDCELRGTGIIKNGVYDQNEPLIVRNTKLNYVDDTAGFVYSVIVGCQSYNPVGVIALPVFGGDILYDKNGTDTIQNNTQYANWQSAKNIYISGGTVSNVTISGTLVFAATGCMVHLEPKDTFIIVWSAPPTIVVIGE